MTRIRPRLKPVWHETGISINNRAICVAETPHAQLFKLKGQRTHLSLPWSMAYMRAAFCHADQQRAQKPRRRGLVSRGRL